MFIVLHVAIIVVKGVIVMYIMEAEKIPGFFETGYYFQRTNGRQLSGLLHTHTFYEFFYIAAGSCIHEINGEKAELHAGDFVFITPQLSHRFLSQTENTDVIVLSVIRDELEKLFSFYEICDFPTLHSVLKLPIEKRKILLSLCENIVFAEIKEYIKDLRMIATQMFLFCTEKVSRNTEMPPYFAEILDKMQDISYFAEGIPAFIRLSGYSHSQLCRLTQKHLGITPTEWINQIRMSHAYKLIVYSDIDYETICVTVGFKSFSYFSKLVKEYFGCSASKLRKNFKGIQKTV